MGSSTSAPVVVARPVETAQRGALDAASRSGLEAFCRAVPPAALGRREAFVEHLGGAGVPAVVAGALFDAGPVVAERLAQTVAALQRGDPDALGRLMGSDAAAAVASAECFWKLCEGEEEEGGPCSEAERLAVVAAAAGLRHGGVDVGRLLLWRCCGVPVDRHGGRSLALGDRVTRWRLQAAVAAATETHGAPWAMLYSSLRDGVGVAAFGRAVGCYAAPTVVLVRTAHGDVLGCFSDTEWRPSGRFFGGGRCRVFSVAADGAVSVYSTTHVASNYLYFHLPSSKAQLAGTVPDGIGAGGQLGAFRLHVDADFRRGEASVFDSTYANGQLAPRAAALDPLNADVVQFDVTAVEVWGLGGAQAAADKVVREQQEIKEAMKRRQVNRKVALGGEDGDENVDMWLVQTAGAHQSYVKDANHNDC